MNDADRSDHDRHRIAKRIAELEKMLRSLQHTKRSTKRVHNIALSGEAAAAAAMAMSSPEDTVQER